MRLPQLDYLEYKHKSHGSGIDSTPQNADVTNMKKQVGHSFSTIIQHCFSKPVTQNHPQCSIKHPLIVISSSSYSLSFFFSSSRSFSAPTNPFSPDTVSATALVLDFQDYDIFVRASQTEQENFQLLEALGGCHDKQIIEILAGQ